MYNTQLTLQQCTVQFIFDDVAPYCTTCTCSFGKDEAQMFKAWFNYIFHAVTDTKNLKSAKIYTVLHFSSPLNEYGTTFEIVTNQRRVSRQTTSNGKVTVTVLRYSIT
jgi:hypothetical protein